MPVIPDNQRSPYGRDAKRPAAQVAASKRAAETKARNAPRAAAAALINTPGLLTGDVDAPATTLARRSHDERHVHGARAPPAPLRQWVRFKDLRTAGVVSSWPQLLRLVVTENFPAGRYLGPSTRVWAVDEIEDWLESRPAGGTHGRDERAAEEAAP
jgi:hypothetical protein